MNPLQRILLVRPDKIGDLITSTAVAASLKRRDPDIHLAVWCGFGLTELAQACPSFNSIREVPNQPPIWQIPMLATRMRQGKFDAVLILKPAAGAYVTAARLAGIPIRSGCTEKGYAKHLTQNSPIPWGEDGTHVVERQLKVAEGAVGRELERLPYSIDIDAHQHERARNVLRRLGIDEDYFLVHPGTGGSAEPWDEQGFMNIGLQLSTQGRVLVTGSARESDLAGRIADAIPGGVSAAGELGLLEFAAAVGGARLVVCGNTSTVHFAASQQTPVVMVEQRHNAAVRAGQWGPWMSPGIAIALSPGEVGQDRVWEACRTLLQEARDRNTDS
jgi:ADP-heptose:LPS heptosyltransferase